MLYPTNTVLTTDTTVLLVSTGTISIVLIILICIIVCGICIVVKIKQQSSEIFVETSINPYVCHNQNEVIMEPLYAQLTHIQDNPAYGTNKDISSTIEPTENVAYVSSNDYDYVFKF